MTPHNQTRCVAFIMNCGYFHSLAICKKRNEFKFFSSLSVKCLLFCRNEKRSKNSRGMMIHCITLNKLLEANTQSTSVFEFWRINIHLTFKFRVAPYRVHQAPTPDEVLRRPLLRGRSHLFQLRQLILSDDLPESFRFVLHVHHPGASRLNWRGAGRRRLVEFLRKLKKLFIFSDKSLMRKSWKVWGKLFSRRCFSCEELLRLRG